MRNKILLDQRNNIEEIKPISNKIIVDQSKEYELKFWIFELREILRDTVNSHSNSWT